MWRSGDHVSYPLAVAAACASSQWFGQNITLLLIIWCLVPLLPINSSLLTNYELSGHRGRTIPSRPVSVIGSTVSRGCGLQEPPVLAIASGVQD